MRTDHQPATAAPWIAERQEFTPESAPMTRDEVLALLEELLEGERAGAKAAMLCRDDTMDPGLDSGLRAIGVDEGHFCSMLVGHIERLDATPGRAVGKFYDKLRAIAGLAERLAFLNRGQRWVVRKIDEALPAIADTQLRHDLRTMRDVHVHNVARCDALIAQLQNGR